MDQDQLSEFRTIVAGLDSRLRRLENKLYGSDEVVTPAPHAATTPRPRIVTPPSEREKRQSEPTNLLGILGVGCLIVAMILLIKFSIDSGWLNPHRQVLLAAVFGASLISIPFFIGSNDKSYVSLLPSAGIVVLHLTIYGSIFLHHIIDPVMGLWLIWAVGMLSLWLLSTFNEDIFAIFAIAGTYAGSYLLKDSFVDVSKVAVHIILWDLVFATFAIKLRNRSLISIAAYFSLGLVVFFAFSMDTLTVDAARQIATIQLIQILIFAVATGVYSVSNKLILREREAWMLFPVFIFFYGQEFYFLNWINATYATLFSLAFAVVILGIYGLARMRLGKAHLESSSAVLTFVSVMVFHSVYFVMLDDLGKLFFGLFVILNFAFFKEAINSPAMVGTKVLSLLIAGYSMMLILANPGTFTDAQGLMLGLAYATALLGGYKASKNIILVSVANVMVVVAICRLGTIIGESWVGPICVAYGFGCLIVALKDSDKLLARAALPVMVFAIGRFLIFNFGSLAPGPRIVSLLVMGALIYGGGFVYRKIPSKG